MIKRIIALLLCLCMVTALFVACDKTGDEGKTTDPTAAPSEPEVTAEPGETEPDPTAEPEGPEVGPDGRVVAAEQVYRTLYSGEVDTMNYLYTGTTNNLVVGANTIDSLVENDPYGNIVPSGAESWEVSEDGLTWTFHLRPGQYWYDLDGNQKEEVTAHDYVASVQYVCNAAFDCTTYMTCGWVVGAQEYYDYTSAVLGGFMNEAGEYLEEDPAENPEAAVVPEVKPEEIGVVAVDDYTLEYHLVIPRPYFLTALQFGPYWPAPKTLLEELGDGFAVDNTTMWFNGAYILSTFSSSEKRIYTKNVNNWDAEHIYIEQIIQTYNAEASTLAPELFLQGQVDYASIGSDIITDWLADPEKSELVSTDRIIADYSYFMGFNFEPKFAEEYEPANWAIAVNNENFRKAIFHGLDRATSTEARFPGDDPEIHLIETITPAGFAMNNGKDYVTYGDLGTLTESFDEAKALEYKTKAVDELTALGCTFPIKIPMNYNPSTSTWANECVVIEQQLEKLLGADFIDIIVLAWSGNSFLGETRRNGNYAIQVLNWGADYADPETWTDPFAYDNNYNFAYRGTEDTRVFQNTKTEETMLINDEYFRLVDLAKAEYFDIDNRFELFAAAEYYYINHAMVIPMYVSGGSYQATKLNAFEGQYACMGQSTSRYKGQKVYETAMTQAQFDELFEAWKTAMDANS